MKVKIEGKMPRSEEIVSYYEKGEGNNNTISQAFIEAKFFFKSSGYLVGKGGHHVWIADKNGKRLAIITER